MGEQQSAAMPELNDGDCYGFERNSAGDFPFYRQPPNALSGRSWVLILLGVVLGFAVLTASPLPMMVAKMPCISVFKL